jgi:hypothetical protein
LRGRWHRQRAFKPNRFLSTQAHIESTSF